MQDDWLDVFGEVTNSLSSFEKLEQKIAPKLAEIQQNSEGANPELLAILNKEMSSLKGKREELNSLKKTLANFKL